jgi:uncharacterized protein with LGFP repeats
MTPVSSVPAPGMVSRAGWQADESIRRQAPQYAAAVKVVFVHHTDTTNNYSCADSPAIVRSLYAYHVLSLGWNDIGYNFLVDRCGTLFEGRYGGTDRPVVGAQVYGFNTDSSGVAIIGTFTTAAASSAALATVARLAAWKLALSGISPTATSTLVEGASDSYGFVGGRTYTFAAISGHRDGYATACPGAALYAQLPALRATAAADARTASTLAVSAVGGATAMAGRYYTQGRVTISWTSSLPASLLAGYAVLVDGQSIVSTGPSSRVAAVVLTAGSHTVAVRATYLSAATTTSANTTVISDSTAPTFTRAPTVYLRAGTVNKTGAPVIVSWRAADDTALAKVVATSPGAATFGPATTTWNTVIVPGAHAYALTAYDGAGNSTSASTTATVTLLPETVATSTGTWAVDRNREDLGGAALTSGTRNAALSWTFTGRGVAWIASRGPTSGQAAIYLDGNPVATVDLAAAAAAYRQIVWTRTGLTFGRHTLMTVVLATPRRPAVTTDGIGYVS